MRDALGTSNSATSLIVGGIYLLAALVYPFAGMLSDRRDDRCGMAALGLAFYCVGGVGVALLPHSMLRVAALVVLQIGNPIFMTSFWCVPTKFLKGPSAAAGIALISSIGTRAASLDRASSDFSSKRPVAIPGRSWGSRASRFSALLYALACAGRPRSAPAGD